MSHSSSFSGDYSWTDARILHQLWRDDRTRSPTEPSDRVEFLGSVVYISTSDWSAAIDNRFASSLDGQATRQRVGPSQFF